MNFKNIKTQIDLDYLYEEGMTFDELDDVVEQYITEQEIIYYSEAIKILSKKEPSLTKSMELASEIGYDVISIDRETLATLLHQDELRQEWWEVRDEVEEMLDNRKSFYNKCKVNKYTEDGETISDLISYWKKVASYNHTTNEMKVYGYYSATTARHINAFLSFYGFDICNKQQLENYQ